MVLADRMKRDIPQQHDLVIFFMKNRLEVNQRIDLQPGGQLRVSAGDAIWGSAQAFPVWVFTDRDHDFTDSPFDAG